MTNFLLPSATFMIKYQIDEVHLAACLEHWRELPTRAEGFGRMKAEYVRTRGAIKGHYGYYIMADDSVVYARVGPKGGFNILWEFGKEGG